jgi:hypothetical protein
MAGWPGTGHPAPHFNIVGIRITQVATRPYAGAPDERRSASVWPASFDGTTPRFSCAPCCAARPRRFSWRTLLRLDSTRSETGEILAPVARCSDRQPQRCVNKVCNHATNLLDAVLRMAPGIGARRAGSGPPSDDDGPGCDCCLDEWAGDLGTAFVRPAPSEAARNRGLIFGS